MDAACEKSGVKKQDVLEKVSQAKQAHDQLKVTLLAHVAKANDVAGEHTAKLVEKLNGKLGPYAGVVPEKPIDLLVFTVYSGLVLYVIFRVFRFCLSLFCFFCCCGCCKRSPKVGENPKSKTAKKAAAVKANGKKA